MWRKQSRNNTFHDIVKPLLVTNISVLLHWKGVHAVTSPMQHLEGIYIDVLQILPST
jgi:hypothetical protein